MRLSDAERDELIGRLSHHAATGRLSMEELEHRIEIVAKAETVEQAREAMTDLPAAPSSQRPPRLRQRGHGQADRPAPEWQPTRERFRDPRTGAVMRVWLDAGGGRHYVPDEG